MPLVEELTGENYFVKIAGTTYKCQGTINLNLRAREANGRGSGDATPRPKAIGLEDGSSVDVTIIHSNLNLLSLNGTEVTDCDVLDGTATVLGAFSAFLNVSQTADVAGMVQFAVAIRPVTMPPVISHLDY